MNQDQQLVTSLRDANFHPPSPRQTPTSAAFPSPVSHSPDLNQGLFHDAGGWTPRFAEDYSVFNSTPGNLRGTRGPFEDLVPPATPAGGHKRLLSAESLAIDIAIHVNHLAPKPSLSLPPVDPSRQLASSPISVTLPHPPTVDSNTLPSPNPASPRQSSKKARRGTVTATEAAQTATPPPTARKEERRLDPSVIMQNDQSYVQSDFIGSSQATDPLSLMAVSGDMFGYPLSAPVTAPTNFWDPSVSMAMDLDFGVAANVFQAAPVQSHRHTGSFDWNSEVQLFQDPSAPPLAPTGQDHVQHQDNMVQPVRRERTLAPKPLTAGSNMVPVQDMAGHFSMPLDDPFSVMNPGDAVNPGLLFSRPQSATMDTAINNLAQTGSAEAAIAESGSRTPMGEELRRSSSVKDIRGGRLPDRTFTSSPVKANRPGLGRSMSENRGKRAQARPVLPKLAPAAPRPTSQASNGPVAESARSLSRPSGRVSPLKSQHRLSSLASIPETTPQPRTRTSVRFTIDSRGRARAETTVLQDDGWGGSLVRRQPSRDGSHRDDLESPDDDDNSSSDDEPIIIPSRANSFNASFALPDPIKPVGSIFHSSRRSVSDRSTESQHDGESEAETVMNERNEKVGDAASELRKVVEDRQKWSQQMGSAKSQRFLHANGYGNAAISPSKLSDSSLGVNEQDIRCVCHRAGISERDGFMIQCGSCEMWLHGSCVGINRQTMPQVYICRFCANTTNTRQGRMRGTGRDHPTAGSALSPLANKSFRTFR